MAHRLPITGSPDGMKYIWNVSNTVGTRNTEANMPTDVELVKLLMKLTCLKKPSFKHMMPGCVADLRSMTVNGIMDTKIGFAIYYSQVEYGWTADGAVSVAPKHYNERYTIVRFNLMLRANDEQAWENLPKYCSPALRRELETFKS